LFSYVIPIAVAHRNISKSLSLGQYVVLPLLSAFFFHQVNPIVPHTYYGTKKRTKSAVFIKFDHNAQC